MIRTPELSATATAAALLLAVTACAPEQTPLPAPAGDPPAAAAFLPPLPEHRTDDTAETGEVAASLDDGEIPYAEIRRRLILDEEGFASGEVMVVTFPPGSEGPERFLSHWFGELRGEPVEIAGEAMRRISTRDRNALVWAGEGFVVVFSRGAERDDAWLESLAAATATRVG